jgi:glycosyltransferase involved in cell wall biosynthesis
MGAQDGVDHAVRALAALREQRDDWHAVFVGEGDALDATRALVADLGLAGHVEFTGFLTEKADLTRIIATADVCLAPEPRNALNEKSTMIKIAEYMSMGRPVVAYDLAESRFSAGEAAAYARSDDPRGLAECVDALLDDDERRARMGAIGRARVVDALAWEHSERALLAAYEHALSARPTRTWRRLPTLLAARPVETRQHAG